MITRTVGTILLTTVVGVAFVSETLAGNVPDGSTFPITSPAAGATLMAGSMPSVTGNIVPTGWPIEPTFVRVQITDAAGNVTGNNTYYRVTATA
jgi:hypothetical protein